MALTQITTGGLLDSSVTNAKISPTVQLGGPTISQIQITDSSYNVLDDTAVSTSGGYIKITGTGFAAGAVVVINATNATSTAFVSSTVLNVQVPAMSAGTYTVYVVNSNGGTAIGVNGLTYSGTPTWVTSSTLPNGTSGSAISIQLSATGDTPMTYALAAGNTIPSGLTLTSGGLLSGTVTVGVETVYAFTIVATDVQLQDSPRAFTITITVGDPYFYLTTLLLPGNGTNNGNNNTFIDGSTNNFTVTRYGNTTQGTFTPFSLTGWSNYFNGSSALSATSNAAFGVGTGDFTIEAWLYPTSWPAAGNFSAFFQVSGTGLWVGLNNAGFGLRQSATSNIISYGVNPTVNTWTHVAVVRSGTTCTLYYNGTSVATATSSANFSTGAAYIAADETPSSWYTGYISNLRLVKGTAVYTGNFTPSTTALTAISGTSLLACQSNRFRDNSSNAFALSTISVPSVQSLSPFAPGASYSTSTIGGAGYFDGSGDYLDITDSSNLLDLGGAAKSVEAWFYPNGTGTYVIFDKSGGTADWNASTGFEWQIQFVSGIFNFYYNSSTNPVVLTDSVTRPAYQWYHIAVATNASNAISLYINGTRVATATNAITKPTNRTLVRLGQDVSGNYYNGYVSGLRFLSGANAIDPTQSTITVPSAPPTAISGTQLLYNFTNGQITDATSKNLLEGIGTPKTSTTQSKWGGSSIYLDGTSSNYINIKESNLFVFGTGNFTVETWIYLPTISRRNDIISHYINLSDAGWVLYVSPANKLTWGEWNQSPVVGATSLVANTWYHIAAARSGSTLKLFLNGVEDGSATVARNYTSNSQGLNIGSTEPAYSADPELIGYINDLRITKGYARYTANFTPPTSAFPTL